MWRRLRRSPSTRRLWLRLLFLPLRRDSQVYRSKLFDHFPDDVDEMGEVLPLALLSPGPEDSDEEVTHLLPKFIRDKCGLSKGETSRSLVEEFSSSEVNVPGPFGDVAAQASFSILLGVVESSSDPALSGEIDQPSSAVVPLGEVVAL